MIKPARHVTHPEAGFTSLRDRFDRTTAEEDTSDPVRDAVPDKAVFWARFLKKFAADQPDANPSDPTTDSAEPTTAPPVAPTVDVTVEPNVATPADDTAADLGTAVNAKPANPGGGRGGGKGKPKDATDDSGGADPIGPGRHDLVFAHDGEDRKVFIDVPSSFDPANPDGYPVVFVFHGLNADAEGMIWTGMSDAGEAEGFITVYPDSVQGSWNTGHNGETHDDLGFVLALVNELVTNWNADADAIFATGHSQGGYLSQYLADQAPDVFAAYAAVASGMPVLQGDNQTEDEPFIFFHSTEDPMFPYEGWDIGNGQTWGGAEAAVDHWAAQNATTMGNFVAMPDSADDGMTTAVRTSADGSIAHYVTDGDSHGWPGTQYWNEATREVTYDINATDLIVDFFSDYGL
ncbi:MAG: alpha/beta hydrolase-fold protein [Marinibacterium sp.]